MKLNEIKRLLTKNKKATSQVFFWFIFLSFLENCIKFAPAITIRQYVLTNAKIAQLVERHLAKVEVAGSNPVFRSRLLNLGENELESFWNCDLGRGPACRQAGSNPVFRSIEKCRFLAFFWSQSSRILRQAGSSGGIGRHVGLKIQWTLVRAGSSPASST